MLSKLLKLFPSRPRYLFNIFSGTLTLKEIKFLISTLVFRRRLNEDVCEKFESIFAQKVEQNYAVSFQAGRHALFAGLAALEIGPGDEIIIPAYTCVVVPNAIIYRGAIPVYVDIQEQDFNIDPKKIKEKISSKTKAIYAQHSYGFPCNMEELKEIAKKHNLSVIEDGAHSIGLNPKCRGDFSFYSTDHSKIINTMIGGVATTDREDIYLKLKSIQSSARELSKKNVRSALWNLLLESICYYPTLLWLLNPLMLVLNKMNIFFLFKDELSLKKPDGEIYPLRMAPEFCQIGSYQMENLEANLNHRRKIFKILNQSKKFGRNFSENEIAQSAPLRFTFLATENLQSEVLQSLRKYSEDLGIWFTSVVHGRNEDLHEVGYTEGSCPVAERIVRENINIPTHFYVTEEIAEKMKEDLDRL